MLKIRNLRTFSSLKPLQAQVVQETSPSDLSSSFKTDPIMLVSEYGDLLNIRPVSRSRSSKTGKTDLREVRMICDNTEAKTLLKQLKGNQSTFFLFNPS